MRSFNYIKVHNKNKLINGRYVLLVFSFKCSAICMNNMQELLDKYDVVECNSLLYFKHKKDIIEAIEYLESILLAEMLGD